MSHSMGSARGQTIRCCGISMCRNRVAAGAVANPRSRWSTSTLRLLPSRRWLSSSPKTLTLPRVFGDAQGSDISLGHRFDIIPKAAESDGPSAPELQGGSGQLLELLETLAFGGGGNKKLPTQGDAVVAGVEQDTVAVLEPPVQGKGGSELDYLQELIAIQQGGPKVLGFFGTRNMGFLHQQLIEILSYAMVLTDNHVITSGATGTNAAVIRGALRAEKPHLLTVVLPQSLRKQPSESQELLQKVENVVEMPDNDCMPLLEASRICNRDILSRVQQVICFAFHDSRLLLETCSEAKEMRKIVTLFYLD